MITEATRLFDRKGDQAMSTCNGCPRGDIVGELQGLSLLHRMSWLIESLVFQHGGHVDGCNGGIDQEMLAMAMEVE